MTLSLPATAADAGRKPKQIDVSSLDLGAAIEDIEFDGSFSANGRWAVGRAIVRIPDTSNTIDHVILLDTRKRRVRLLSRRAADGGPSAKGGSQPAISADGRHVVFTSRSTDLTSDGTTDENEHGDIFLHDVAAGTTRVLSKRAGTDQTGNDYCFSPTFSPDGRHVVFSGAATDLVTDGPQPSATGRRNNVFLHELETGRTTLVSVTADGTSSGDGSSEVPGSRSRERVFSADGRFLLFHSRASDLVGGSGDNAGAARDVFVRDLERGVTELISVTDSGRAFGIDGRYQPNAIGIGADGRYVVFSGRSPEITDPDYVNQSDVFVRDRESGRTIVVTRSTIDGGPSEGSNWARSMSADGRRIVFQSRGAELGFEDVTGGEAEISSNVYLYDADSDSISLITHRRGDERTTGDFGSESARISANGRYIVFASAATDLVRKKRGNGFELYSHDVKKGRTRRLTNFGKQSGSNVFSDVHGVRLDPKGKTALFRAGRYSLVDRDFEEDERVLILRTR